MDTKSGGWAFDIGATLNRIKDLAEGARRAAVHDRSDATPHQDQDGRAAGA